MISEALWRYITTKCKTQAQRDGFDKKRVQRIRQQYDNGVDTSESHGIDTTIFARFVEKKTSFLAAGKLGRESDEPPVSEMSEVDVGRAFERDAKAHDFSVNSEYGPQLFAAWHRAALSREDIFFTDASDYRTWAHQHRMAELQQLMSSTSEETDSTKIQDERLSPDGQDYDSDATEVEPSSFSYS